MTRFYQFFVALACLVIGNVANGQRIVDIPASDDPGKPTDLTPAIMGDTMPSGDRMDNNTVYRLANGVVYTITSPIRNTPDWPLQIEAVDLEQTEQRHKPVITTTPNDVGDYPRVLEASGDVHFRNLWIINGARGPGENPGNGMMRFFGTRSKITVTDCVLEKDRGGLLSFRADSLRVYVDNCILRNAGNRFAISGNGRAIDCRNFSVDTLIVRNSVMHNITDRILRSLGAVLPHNYIEFDQNTIFNHVGKHGCFIFAMAHAVKVTNNLMINPLMLGASPYYANEQNNPDGTVNKVFTLDTLVDPTIVTISNNNIFWTQDIIDIWAKHDTVSRPPIYSTLIAQAMGDTSNGHFEEVLELNNVPKRLNEYLDAWLANPNSEELPDYLVEDIGVAGTALDFGNLFDFLGTIDDQPDFDPCYDVSGTISGTAATDGGPVGARTICNLSTSIFQDDHNPALLFTMSPNPVRAQVNLAYRLSKSGLVRLSIYDLGGRLVEIVVNDIQQAGSHSQLWKAPEEMPRGAYLTRLQTQEGQMTKVIILE